MPNEREQEQLGNLSDKASPSQTRSVLLARIQNILKEYSDIIKDNVSSGRSDILIDSEIIFRDLLNKVYMFKLVLANQNPPDVDLIDKDNGIAVKITSDNIRSTLKNICTQFLEHRFSQSYNTFFVLVLVYAPLVQNTERLFAQLRENGVELQIKTLWDLTREIGLLPLELISDIADFLDQNIGTDTLQEQPTTVSVPLPSIKVDDLTDVMRQTLCLATLLPPLGLERTVLELGLEREQKHALVDLIHHGFLLEEGSVIRIHPAFQNSNEYSPSQDECTFLLEQLWYFEDNRRWDRFTLRTKTQVTNSLAQLFANAFEIFPSYPIYAQHSAELWRNMQHYANALKLGKQALSGFRSTKNDSWDVARALHFNGDCHIKQKHPELALVDWKQTLELCQHPLRASAFDLAEAYHNVGIALLELKKYQEAKDILLTSLKISENLRKENRDFLTQPYMKRIYNSLATVYTALSDVQHAALCTKNAILHPNEQEDLWEILTVFPHTSPIRHLWLPVFSALGNGFVGREKELADIHDRFARGDKLVVLTGLGGMGKTELAVKFGLEYEGTVYFARFAGSFTKTLANMAQGVRPALGDEELGESEDNLCAMVLELLSEAGKDDLLIIDNVDSDTDSLADLQKDVGYKALMRLPLKILVTTRLDWYEGIPVERITNKHLRQILTRYGAKLTEEEMDAIIQTVKGHTLTLDLIARTLNGKGLRKVTTEMLIRSLRENTLSSEKYRKITTHYNLSTEQVQLYQHLSTVFNVSEISDSDKELLRCATLFPESGISGDLITRIMNDEGLVQLEYLVKRGWLEMKDDLLTIHPVIRLVCRTELIPTDENCGDFLNALWEEFDEREYDRIKYAQLAEVFALAAEQLEDQEARWINNSGRLLNDLAQHDAARNLYEKHLPDLEKRLKNTEPLAIVYNNLGYAYGNLGDHRMALEYLLKALEIQEKVLLSDHPDLARSYNNVGTTYGDLGDHRMALEYKLKALEIREKVLPPEHPDLAQSYNNVGMTYGDLGDHRMALEYKLKALKILEKVLPPDHPSLATCYNNVGMTYGDLGDHYKALEYTTKGLVIIEKVLPPEHPDLAASYNNLGATYGDLGDHSKALEFQLKALEIQEKVLPPDHPDLAASYNNVGLTYSSLGDNSKALEYLLKALEIRERVLPLEHPDLAASYNNVGNIYGDLGDHSRALEYLLKALEIRETVLPPDHPYLATSYNNIGSTYAYMENFPKAVEYLEKALGIMERILPPGHPNIETMRRNLMGIRFTAMLQDAGISLDDVRPADDDDAEK